MYFFFCFCKKLNTAACSTLLHPTGSPLSPPSSTPLCPPSTYASCEELWVSLFNYPPPLQLHQMNMPPLDSPYNPSLTLPSSTIPYFIWAHSGRQSSSSPAQFQVIICSNSVKEGVEWLRNGFSFSRTAGKNNVNYS